MKINKRSLFKALFGACGFVLFGGIHPAAEALEDNWKDPEWLERWLSAKRLPVRDPQSPELKRWARAVGEGSPVLVRYFGAKESGSIRKISPTALNEIEGFAGVYLNSYCHKRQKPRTFRCDALEMLKS